MLAPIPLVVRMKMMEWFGCVKRRNETENVRAVAHEIIMKMEKKRPIKASCIVSVAGSESIQPEVKKVKVFSYNFI